jgi:hypothetical protein
MNLPHRLFWDIDLKTINLQENARFIIQRVIQKGEIQDWISIKKLYGIDLIKKEILQLRHLDDKTLSFFSIYFDIKKENFRCYTTQPSTQRHFNF